MFQIKDITANAVLVIFDLVKNSYIFISGLKEYEYVDDVKDATYVHSTHEMAELIYTNKIELTDNIIITEVNIVVSYEPDFTTPRTSMVKSQVSKFASDTVSASIGVSAFDEHSTTITTTTCTPGKMVTSFSDGYDPFDISANEFV